MENGPVVVARLARPPRRTANGDPLARYRAIRAKLHAEDKVAQRIAAMGGLKLKMPDPRLFYESPCPSLESDISPCPGSRSPTLDEMVVSGAGEAYNRKLREEREAPTAGEGAIPEASFSGQSTDHSSLIDQNYRTGGDSTRKTEDICKASKEVSKPESVAHGQTTFRQADTDDEMVEPTVNKAAKGKQLENHMTESISLASARENREETAADDESDWDSDTDSMVSSICDWVPRETLVARIADHRLYPGYDAAPDTSELSESSSSTPTSGSSLQLSSLSVGSTNASDSSISSMEKSVELVGWKGKFVKPRGWVAASPTTSKATIDRDVAYFKGNCYSVVRGTAAGMLDKFDDGVVEWVTAEEE
ncbi:hypothetical protein BD324DRAFT_650655 [Kockovaella imperatae]|uniref:Uncharacterized protein n=1 Tax=Kockovaella imperatae TaxID=4999 RepID=A0A1Y1UG48_9TREE|nr:hypothetical protein BD324DRAFT_650655 [Kockovaella imperatae]ORX37040.1 hypothetical protein BD324DRAFT_650655 [Kockovaella imperatae]